MARGKVKKKPLNWVYIFAFFVLASIGTFILKKSSDSRYCANPLSCKESLELIVDNEGDGIYNGQAVAAPKVDLAKEQSQTQVLAETAGNNSGKHIYVDLTTQTLTAVENGEVYMQVPVSTGKWGRTPTGEFTIWTKIRSTKMSGGSGADYYYLPNVPYVMYFSGSGIPAARGFGFHGTYWHNNF
jgi:lipoprotein-anchoring transpeptidase ErfK/SrfK